MQFFRELQHGCDFIFLFIRQLFHGHKQELSASFKVFAQVSVEFTLHVFVVFFHRPRAISGDMKLVNDDGGVREEPLGNVCIDTVHVGDKILDIVPFLFGESTKIVNERGLRSLGKDINDFFMGWIGKNTLKFALIGVAFKFVDRKGLR